MVGAVAGTPGTLPTNWIYGGSGKGTLAQQIVATGTVNGMAYVDLRLSGTTSTTGVAIQFDSSTFITATAGQTWCSSVYLALQAGSFTNITAAYIAFAGFDAGVVVESYFSSDIKSSITSTLKRFQISNTLIDVSTSACGYVLLTFAAATTIDVTLRIALPQFEQGAFASSPILTSTTAVTRASETITSTPISWYNATQGTMFVQGILDGLPDSANTPRWAAINNGATSNELAIVESVSTQVRGNIRVTSALVFNQSSGITMAALGTLKAALAAQAGVCSVSANGNDAVTASIASMPTGINKLSIGTDGAGANGIDGWFQSFSYYNTALSSADIKTLTT